MAKRTIKIKVADLPEVEAMAAAMATAIGWDTEGADWVEKARTHGAEVARLRSLLDTVLGQFTEKGHPGAECLRTPWLRVETIEKWRSEAAPAARGSEDG